MKARIRVEKRTSFITIADIRLRVLANQKTPQNVDIKK